MVGLRCSEVLVFGGVLYANMIRFMLLWLVDCSVVPVGVWMVLSVGMFWCMGGLLR